MRHPTSLLLLALVAPCVLSQGYGGVPQHSNTKRTTTTFAPDVIPSDQQAQSFLEQHPNPKPQQGYPSPQDQGPTYKPQQPQQGYPSPQDQGPFKDNTVISSGSFASSSITDQGPQQNSGNYWWAQETPFKGAGPANPSQSACGGTQCGGGQPSGISPGNPFLNPQGPAQQKPVHQGPAQGPACGYGGCGDQQTQGLTVACSIPGHVCVPKHTCSNGVIVGGVPQVTGGVQKCDVSSQACCRLPSGGQVPNVRPNPPVRPPSYQGQGKAPGTNGIPIGGSIYDNAPRPPPPTYKPYTGPLNTTPYPGCAAALKCVEIQFCTAEGVMVEQPVYLTREQDENRVPLSECSNPETGILGKCCRDPNYKDPWPAGMPMPNMPGMFDQSGFPTGQYFDQSKVNQQPGFNPPPFPNQPKPQPQQPYQTKPQPQQPYQPPQQPYQPKPQPQQPYQPKPQPQQPYQPKPQPQQPYQPPQQPYQPKPQPQQPYQPKPQPQQPYQPKPQPQQPYQPKPQPNQPYEQTQETYQPPKEIPRPQQPFQPPRQPDQSYQPPPQEPYQPPRTPDQPQYNPPQPNVPEQRPYQPQQPEERPATYPQVLPPRPSETQPGAKCGVKRPVQQNGLGESEAGFGEYPWHVVIMRADNRKPLCSGALISNKAVVTAAHCVQELDSSDLMIECGVWRLNSQSNPRASQTSPVAALARHPNHDEGTLANDMAVLLLAIPMQLDEHIDTLCLPQGQPSQQQCVATGYSKDALKANAPNSPLNKIDVNFVPSNVCEQKLKATNLGKYFVLNPSFQCAVPANPADDLCKVGAGGPVACDRGNGQHELSAIYSWDVGCTNPTNPTALAGVDTPWIESVLNSPLQEIVKVELNEIERKRKSQEVVDQESKPGFSQGYGK